MIKKLVIHSTTSKYTSAHISFHRYIFYLEKVIVGVTGSDIDNGCVYHIMSRVVPAGVSSLEIELKMCCLGLKMKLTRLFCAKAI